MHRVLGWPKPYSCGMPKLLKLRKDHPVATVFVDETGAIARDRFFAVGLLKVEEPAVLLRAVQKWRDKRHWYKEIKYYDVTRSSLELYKEVVDLALSVPSVQFYCFVADRDAADPVARFGTHWDAYEKMAEQMITACIKPNELLTVLADNYSTPDEVLFEQTLRANINRRLRRLALVSVCRLDSKSADGLQIVDLLTSACALEFRLDAGLASPTSPKAELSRYVRERLGATSCLGGWKNDSHSVAVYRDGREAPASEGLPTT